MKTTVLPQPIMLFEALELVRAFANSIPPLTLAGNSTYSIPSDALEQMIADVCCELDREDRELQFYFQTYRLDDSKYGETCVARALVYFFMDLECSDMKDHLSMLTSRWLELKGSSLEMTGINAFSPEFKVLPDGEWKSWGSLFDSLALERSLTLALVEAFSDYVYHINRLGELLWPVAQKLRFLLEPWIKAAEPLSAAWNDFFAEASIVEFLFHRAGLEDDFVFHNLVVSLRYIDACTGPAKMSESGQTIWIHMGVALPVGMKRLTQQQPLEENKYEAFRLLSDRTRADMLQLLSNQSLKMQDIASKLDVNPGTISRNLNSMNSAGLLIKETIAGRSFYRTNKDFLRSTFQSVLEYLEGDSVTQSLQEA